MVKFIITRANMFIYLEYLLLSSCPSLSLLVPPLRLAAHIETAGVASKVAMLTAEFDARLYLESPLEREKITL